MGYLEFNDKKYYLHQIQSKPDARDWHIPMANILPDEYLKDFNRPVIDQGSRGNCTVCTVDYNGSDTEQKRTNRFIEMSPLMLYFHRDISDWQGTGTEPREVWKHWLHEGNCYAKDFIVPDYIEYPAGADYFNKIKYKLLRLAYKHRIKAYYALIGVNEIKQAIYAGLHVMLAIPIFKSSFTPSFTNGGYVQIPTNTNKMLNPDYVGDHAVTGAGWTKDSPIRFLNSWGAVYGDKGYGYLPEGYPINEAWAFEYGARFNLFKYIWLWIQQIVHMQF